MSSPPPSSSRPTTAPALVVLGEALIDFKAEGPLRFQGYVGGSPLNVAVAAARLGVRAALAGRVSRDLFGEAIVDHLGRNGVELGLLERSDEPSTLAFVAERPGGVDYAFRREGAADTRYDPHPRPSFPSSLRALHLGSLGLLSPPAADAILEIAAAQRGRALVHLDPNVRPNVLADPVAYRARFERWTALADWVKLSREDLEWLYPGAGESDVAAAALARGPRVVVVTDGGDGARLYRDGRPPLAVPAPPVTVVDTVGAGDTFSATTLAVLLANELERPDGLADLPDPRLAAVVRRAVAASALNCTRAGADPPTVDELGGLAA